MLDPAKEFEKHDELELKNASEHAAIQALIRASGEKFLSLDHNGQIIKIRTAIPANVRSEIIGLARKYKGVKIEDLKRGNVNLADLPDGFMEESLDQLYKALAAICIDEPYNKAGSWKYFDQITGEAELVYQKAQALMEEAHKSALSFREKS